MTFNEINVITYDTENGAGFKMPTENFDAIMLQASHYQLVASAKSVQMACTMMPECLIGMMYLYLMFYAETCNPADQLKFMQKNDIHTYYTDVMVRGYYSNKAKVMWANKGLNLDITEEDLNDLKKRES